MSMLRQGMVIQSETTQQRYRVLRSLGEGGFGAAFLVARLDDRDKELPPTCLKITSDANTWHGEAYFAGLLREERHVVRMIDAFPVMVDSGRAARVRFCIEMEYIEGGTVEDGCSDGRLPWPPDRVARQMKLLLRPLATLHRLGTSHRDITPRNVFLGPRNTLKLGDFGLAKTALKQSGVDADAYTPAYRPPHLGTWWSPADDVYQAGLLALTLCKGEPCDNTTGKVDANPYVPKGHLRDAIKGALGVKSQRFPDAGAMLEVLAR